MSRDLPIPPSSGSQETNRTPGHTHVANAWVRQSTQRDAQVAREMDTTTMHVYVEMPTEQGGASAKVKLGLRWESRPMRGRPRFTWGLRIKNKLQTVDQDLADAGADQVMADVAVVERAPTSSRG